jgi:integrase
MTKTGKYAGIKDTLVRDKAQEGLFVRTRDDGGKTATSYVVIYRVGKQQRKMTLPDISREQARKAAKNILAKVALGQDPQGEKNAKRTASVVGTTRAVFEDFIAHQSTRRRPSSLEATKRYLFEYAKPLHGLKLDASLGRAQVTSVLKSVAKDHGPVAADRCRSALSAAFAWAIGEGACTADFHNPVTGTNKYSEQTFKGRALGDHEITAIWDACGKDDFGIIVKLLLLTGARRDEISRLEWSEVKGDMISLPGSRTKNHLPFDIPLTAVARGFIGSPPDNSKYVFGRYESSQGFSGHSKAKAQLDAKLGDQVKPWRLHDLRHTFSTRLHEDLDIEPHIVEACLNHVSGHKGGVAGRYNHSRYNDQKREALEAWAKRIAVITGKNVTDIGKHRKRRA